MIGYFLQLTGYTLLFYAVYALLLRRQPYAQLSRFFLWATILLPFVLPFLKFSWPQSVAALAPLPLMHYLPEVTFQSGGIRSGMDGSGLLLLIYAVIALVLIFKNARQLLLFRQQLRRAEKVIVAGTEIALLPEHGPGSFGSFIFFPDAEIDPAILRHEQAHVAQRHDVDLLILLFLRDICWPHLLLYLLEKELRLVHEYAADRAAVDNQPENYSHLLLAQTFGLRHVQPNPFIHTFFHHPLKQRIVMLQQQENKKVRRSLMKKATISLMLLCSLILLLSARKVERKRLRDLCQLPRLRPIKSLTKCPNLKATSMNIWDAT